MAQHATKFSIQINELKKARSSNLYSVSLDFEA
jgi:hypothetical protein